jgi:hypothetical protein
MDATGMNLSKHAKSLRKKKVETVKVAVPPGKACTPLGKGAATRGKGGLKRLSDAEVALARPVKQSKKTLFHPIMTLVRVDPGPLFFHLSFSSPLPRNLGAPRTIAGRRRPPELHRRIKRRHRHPNPPPHRCHTALVSLTPPPHLAWWIGHLTPVLVSPTARRLGRRWPRRRARHLSAPRTCAMLRSCPCPAADMGQSYQIHHGAKAASGGLRPNGGPLLFSPFEFSESVFRFKYSRKFV